MSSDCITTVLTGDVVVNPALELFEILFGFLRMEDIAVDTTLHIVPDDFLSQVKVALLKNRNFVPFYCFA